MNKTAVCFRKRTWNLGSDRCGFKACIFHLLAIWPWANHWNSNISLSYVTQGNSTFQELLKELCLTCSRFSKSGAYKKEEEVLSCWKLTIVNEAFSIAKVQPGQPVSPSKDEAPLTPTLFQCQSCQVLLCNTKNLFVIQAKRSLRRTSWKDNCLQNP